MKYNSKVKFNNDKLVSFFTFCFLKIRYLLTNLTLEEKQILIEESFDYITEIEIMSNISKLEAKIKKNVYKESFFVHYYLIKNSINELFYVFSDLKEFDENELKKFVVNLKDAKIKYFMKEFLKNRIKKSEYVVNANTESRNLLFMNIKNLISEFETSESDLNEKLSELIKITREIFLDGKTIIDNFQERKNFISYLYNTVDECLVEGISI